MSFHTFIIEISKGWLQIQDGALRCNAKLNWLEPGPSAAMPINDSLENTGDTSNQQTLRSESLLAQT